MKKELHPGIIAGIIACVVIVTGLFLWKSNTDKPAYQGAMAGHPGSGPMTGPPSGHITPQEAAAKYHISGASPSSTK